MGHLLKMAFLQSADSGLVNASIFKTPTGIPGTLNVFIENVLEISLLGGSDSANIEEGYRVRAQITSYRDAYRELSIISNIRGELFYDFIDAGVNGAINSATYFALENEIITITANYIV